MSHVLAQDLVSGYMVSTIRLPDELRPLDSMIEVFGALMAEEERDRFPGLNAPSALDNRFETMVFPVGDDGEVSDWGELACRRYQNEDEALAGHAAMVEMWRAKESVKP